MRRQAHERVGQFVEAREAEDWAAAQAVQEDQVRIEDKVYTIINILDTILPREGKSWAEEITTQSGVAQTES